MPRPRIEVCYGNLNIPHILICKSEHGPVVVAPFPEEFEYENRDENGYRHRDHYFKENSEGSATVDFSRLDNGIVSFPVSLLIISLLYSYGRVSGSTAIASMFILGFGDGAAAVTGYLLGKTKKSMEGSISMLAVSVVALMLFSGLSFPLCLIVALLATAAERLTPSGLDNLTVPLTAALAMEVICLFR